MASYGADQRPILPQMGTSGRVSMYADTYGVFTSPCDYYSMESPPMKLPVRELLSAAILLIIIELGKRRVARPLVSRRIGGSRIRPAATSDAAATVSVVPKRVRAAVSVYGWCRRGEFRPHPFEFPTVYGMRDPCPGPRLLSGTNFRKERLQPPHYTTQLATNLQKTHIINMAKYETALSPNQYLIQLSWLFPTHD